MTKYICDVTWDTDTAAELHDLPQVVSVSHSDIDLEGFDDLGDALVEHLTDEYGFCVQELYYSKE